MTPILFDATATVFATHGIGPLKDAVSWDVTKAGMQYELRMVYPITGAFFDQIAERKIIYAQPDEIDNPQPFRVYRITKPISGRVTIYAYHISYDLSGYPVVGFEASSAATFASTMAASQIVQSGFNFTTDVISEGAFALKAPASIRSILGSGDNTWQGTYGGELKFDGYTVSLLQSAGADRGVCIKYGVDLVDATMDTNIAAVHTGIVPYYVEDETVVVGDPQYPGGQQPEYIKLLPVNVSAYIATTPDKETVNATGRAWLLDNNIRKPEISLTLDYAQIAKLGKQVQQYDTITVEIAKLGLVGGNAVTAKVSKTVWDGKRGRYSSITVGDVRPTIGDDIFDASRLHRGLLPVQRISDKSVSRGKLSTGVQTSLAAADQAKFDIDTFLDNLAHSTTSANTIACQYLILDTQHGAGFISRDHKNYKPKSYSLMSSDGHTAVELECLAW